MTPAETSLLGYYIVSLGWTVSPWRWRYYNPSTHRKIFIQQYSIISKETWSVSNTAGRT